MKAAASIVKEGLEKSRPFLLYLIHEKNYNCSSILSAFTLIVVTDAQAQSIEKNPINKFENVTMPNGFEFGIWKVKPPALVGSSSE